MRIAFFGSSLTSAYWNGAATYYRGIIRALFKRGIQTTFYEPDAYDRQLHRDIDDPEWAKVVVYPATDVSTLCLHLEEATRSDVIIKASGVGVFDEFLEMAVASVARPGAIKIFWDVDAPATLDRLQRDPADPFSKLIPAFDMVLTYGGGNPVVEAYERAGARLCVPIYNGLDPETHYPVRADPRFTADLGFLGNRLPDREARVREFFFGAATSLPHLRFLIGGNGWETGSMPQNVRNLGHVLTTDHNAFNSSARAVLNVSRDSMARYGFSPATRVFEAAGAAACLVTDAWHGIEQFFEPGREILVASNGGEVAQILHGLDTRTAKTIGQAALRRVLAEHTYSRRAEQFERILNGKSITAA
jgi:spore maturation protein CgeB